MSLLPYLGCVWLGVDSLRGGLAKGNRICFKFVITYNDEICYGKHVSAPFYVFFTLFGCWAGGGLTRGWGNNLLMQCSRLGSSKMEITSQR